VRADLTHQAAASSPDERDQPGQVPFEAADPVGHVAQFARGWLGEHGAGAVDALGLVASEAGGGSHPSSPLRRWGEHGDKRRGTRREQPGRGGGG
jgi:hypothetical protein